VKHPIRLLPIVVFLAYVRSWGGTDVVSFIRQIPYPEPGYNNYDLYIMKADGTQLTNLTNDAAFDWGPTSICPTSRSIVFTRGNNVASYSLVTGTITNITDSAFDNYATDCGAPPGGPVSVLYSSHDLSLNLQYWEIYKYNLDGSGFAQLTQTLDPHSSQDPHWCGSNIVFTSDRDGGWSQIYMMDSSGGNQRRMSFSGTYEYGPSCSPDGTKITFTRWNFTYGTSDIYVMNNCSTPPCTETLLTPGTDNTSEFNPNWTANAAKIVFNSDRTGYYNIYTMLPNGSGVQQLTNSIANLFPDIGTVPVIPQIAP
jgi:Tol biopolymer transport system component